MVAKLQKKLDTHVCVIVVLEDPQNPIERLT